MICPNSFLNDIQKIGIDFFCGVPDSLLKEFNKEISSLSNNKHIITANEGSAISVAAGYHLATKKIAMVYLQNSGLGNTLNPIMSLVHKKVYSIPMLLLIGWRGQPGVKDEPQHLAQGEKMLDQLTSMGVKYIILQENYDIDELSEFVNDAKMPVAIIVKKNTFSKSKKSSNIYEYKNDLSREKALELISEKTHFPIISTTGKCSRELFEIRKRRNQQSKDFYTVGSMGHALSLATGVSIGSKKNIICIDGDGSFIMHMGSALAAAEFSKQTGVIHIMINNHCHESVGGQTTYSEKVNFSKLAQALGYKKTFLIENENELLKLLEGKLEPGTFIEIKVMPGSRSDLGRPTSTPVENKIQFMSHFK